MLPARSTIQCSNFRRRACAMRTSRNNRSVPYVKPHAMPWMQRQAAVPEGSFVDSGQAGDGVPRIVSYRTMRDYPLVLTVGTAYAQALA